MYRKLFILAILHITFLALLAYCFYHKLIKEVNFKLYTAAKSLECMLPEHIVDDAYNNKMQNIIYYDSLIKKANQIAQIHQVTYVYALILRNDSLFFVISSYINNDISKDQITNYLDYYPEGAGVFKQAFIDKKTEPIYTVIADSWGVFTSVIIFNKTAKNHPYLLCADIDYHTIVQRKYNIIFVFVAIIVVIILIVLISFYIEQKKMFKQ